MVKSAERVKGVKASRKRAAKGAAGEPFYQPFAALRQVSRGAAGAARAAASSDARKDTAAAAAAPPASPQPKRAPAPQAVPGAQPPPQRVDPETFAIYMAGVRVLEDRVNRIPTTASRVERAAQPKGPTADPDDDARARMRSLVVEGIRFETTDDGDRLEGRRLDVDPRELRRLRRARYAIDGTLDLHGLHREDARAAVEAFVRKRQADGDRVVAIVHGKGNHSPRGYAVLRGEIAAWLTQGRVARQVAAFATAPDAEGGAGAVLVLLAR
jgi:DNA-nicking Smr family endonuclease